MEMPTKDWDEDGDGDQLPDSLSESRYCVENKYDYKTGITLTLRGGVTVFKAYNWIQSWERAEQEIFTFRKVHEGSVSSAHLSSPPLNSKGFQ